MAATEPTYREEEIPVGVWLQATHPIADWDLPEPLQLAFERVIRATYHAARSSPELEPESAG